MGGIVPWSEASEMVWCHGGSGGVFLLKLPTGAICLKAENCSPSMLFAHRLASLLGVRTAGVRVVSENHQESNAIRCALDSAIPTVKDHKLQVWRARRAAAMMVMEFIPGCGMIGIPAHMYLQKHRKTGALFHGLGRLMAYDLLINNFDRLPLAWSNDGNLANIMLSSSSVGVVGIDQSVVPITHPEGLRNYCARVRKVCADICGGQGASFKAVKEAVYNNTAIELSPHELEQLRCGSLEFLKEIAKLYSSGKMEEIILETSDSVFCEL